jgi:hypothetical protein
MYSVYIYNGGEKLSVYEIGIEQGPGLSKSNIVAAISIMWRGLRRLLQ